MSFLSVLFTLLIEQVRPLSPRNAPYRGYLRYVNSLGNHFNAGERIQGMVAWLLAVLPWVLVSVVIHYFLRDISIAAAWVWNVAVLYLTMGFRQFSHAVTEIVEALRAGDLDRALVLASGAGALGVRLGETLHYNGTVRFRPELGLGDDADVNTMTSAVGMVWRALVLWMFILALITVARWVGV